MKPSYFFFNSILINIAFRLLCKTCDTGLETEAQRISHEDDHQLAGVMADIRVVCTVYKFFHANL